MFKKDIFTSFFESNSLKKAKSFGQFRDRRNHEDRFNRNKDLTYNEWDGASLEPIKFTAKYFDYEKVMT